MTEIPEVHLEAVCKKGNRCKFIGSMNSKTVCIKGSQFAPAIIQLEITYSKESEKEDSDYPKGDNCPGMDKINEENKKKETENPGSYG